MAPIVRRFGFDGRILVEEKRTLIRELERLRDDTFDILNIVF